jgi:hypothetical protein
MFRKLLPLALVLLILASMAIIGCSKKPSDYEPDTDYGPTSIMAYPDTAKVTIKWVRNSEAEAQSGFGGYYVYCTSRRIADVNNNDSIVGLTLLPAESLAYFQVPGCPLSGTDSVVVTSDPTTGGALLQGTKYYFYVRTSVDGELSWASQWAWSSPRPENNASIYSFVSFDTLAPDTMGQWANLQVTKLNTLYKIPIVAWRDTVIDSTATPVTVTIRPATYDTMVCGYVAWDSIATKSYIVWGDTSHITKKTVLGAKVHVDTKTKNLNPSRCRVGNLVNVDLVAEKISSTQVRLVCPNVNTAIPEGGAWNEGRETLIKELPGGWTAYEPVSFLSTDYSVTLTVGQTGGIYQFRTNAGNYGKMRVDSVQTAGNAIKVTFHYAYQMVANLKSF